MSAPESQRFAAALVELTDSTIGLMEATSQRSTNYKHMIESLRKALIQRNQTVNKQSQIIESLSRKYAEMSYLLRVTEDKLRQYGVTKDMRIKDESIDEIKLPSLESLRRSEVIPESSHTLPSPPLSVSQLKLPPLSEQLILGDTPQNKLKRRITVMETQSGNRNKLSRGD